MHVFKKNAYIQKKMHIFKKNVIILKITFFYSKKKSSEFFKFGVEEKGSLTTYMYI